MTYNLIINVKVKVVDSTDSLLCRLPLSFFSHPKTPSHNLIVHSLSVLTAAA